MIWDVLLHAVLPALAVAAIVFALANRLFAPKYADLAGALGLIAGVALGVWLRGVATLNSSDSPWNRLPLAALAALWIGRAARFSELHPIEGWLLRGATASGIAWWVVPDHACADISWLKPAFAIMILAEWAILECSAQEPPGGTIPFALALTFFIAGGVLIHASMAGLTDVSVVLASALVGIAIVAAWRQLDASGIAPALAVLLPGLLLMGQRETFSEVPWQAFVLAAGAPLMLIFAFPMRRWDSVGLRVVQLTLVAFPLVAAMALAMQAGPLEFE
jgi:hypothetical protein